MLPDLPPAPEIIIAPLPYEQRLDVRDVRSITRVVVHCTETPDLSSARQFGETVLYESGTGNSGHFYIDRDGTVHRYVHPERIAHHVSGHNRDSIGIELVNRGRYPDWLDSRRQRPDEPYPDAQIDALIALLARLKSEFPGLHEIAGHEDLDTRQVPASDDPSQSVPRKRDPGPMFPWPRVVERSGLKRAP
ncbi:MAG: N-acetylmuramoyl-L-alanine amidase [Xanthomonadaceae bacterium]|nr:N-acetylmuramoyl-L-alanine amidase [Xanthomonadaceae bacterium]